MSHFNSMRRVATTILAVTITLACFGAQSSAAGQPSSPSASQEQRIEKKEQSQRILGVVPQFGVTNRQNAPRLTPRGKFNLFVKSATDPFTFVAVGLQAGVSQANDEFPSYGQGAAGYAKRYGAALADNVSSGFFANFLYPVLLKDDPRYFRMGEGSVKHRIGYALRQVVVCHTDRGGRSMNLPNILGAFSTGALSNLYYPPESRGAGLTASRSAISLAYGSAGGLLSEFWPDTQKRLLGHHSRE
ncbi:MAG: hypothetical protein ACXVZV_03965 [Terriglobales bacterium]